MAFLTRQGGQSARAIRPDLILLDLNLPKLDGREVLALIKADDGLKTIPTVILTTSEATEDIAKCYELQANSHLNKPVSFAEFENLVLSINDFWLKKSTLPGTAIH
jgi:CheY-like chemotaxis protein